MGDDTFVIGKKFEGGVTFRPGIVAGDSSTSTPSCRPAPKRAASHAQRAVVAYLGLPWERTG